MPDEPRIAVTEGVTTLLRDLVHEHAGLFYDASRLDMVTERLRDRVKARGFSSYLDYYYFLKYDSGAASEWLRVLDAFSVQETYFWRESSQLDLLVRRVVPEWFGKTNEPLTIWSSACASGEEPYTIAMALDQAGLGRLPVRIVASDASELALSRATHGVYRERSFRSIPGTLKDRYFRKHADGWEIDPQIRTRIELRRANIAQPDEVAPLARASVIFCRNVFIYFSPESTRRVVAEFARHMMKPGLLFVGASESLLRMTDDFDLEEIDDAFVYKLKEQKAAA